MKKRITVCAFLALIIITIIVSLILVITEYKYEIANDDIFEGLGAGILLIECGFVVLYEADLFHVVYYFLFKPKRVVKTIFIIAGNLCLIAFFVFQFLSNTNMGLRRYGFILLLLLIAYVIIKIVYFFVWIAPAAKTDEW